MKIARLTFMATAFLLSACASAPPSHIQQYMVRQQIEECWNVPKSAQLPPVEVTLDLDRNGAVKNIEIVDKHSYASDPAFRAVADSLAVAAHNPRCPIRGLNTDSYSQWKHIDLTFDPRDML